MRSPLDRILLAFRRDLARVGSWDIDDCAQLYWDDREAFFAAQDAAWASGRPEPFITLTEVRALNETLSPKTARRLAHRHLAASRFREGAEVIRDPRYGLMQDGVALLDLALMELGLGHADAAAEARARALKLDPSLKAGATTIGGALAAIGAAEAAAASGMWVDIQPLVELWLEAGAAGAALRVIMRFLTHGQPLTREERYECQRVLDTALSLCAPLSAANLFRALGRQPVYEPRREVIETICAMLSAPAGEEPAAPDPAALGTLGSTAALALAQAGKTRLAIAMLGELTFANHKAHYLRMPLAKLIAEDFLKEHPLRYGPPGGKRKVFDLIVFNNELRILNVKLHEMADWVDAFVIVEARQTFSGLPKPLVFQENRDQFAAFADKIIHVVVDEFPPHLRHAWAREYHQRNFGLFGLNGRVREDDLVLISDADEIVSREIGEGFEGDFAVMGMERLRYFLNYRQAMPTRQLKEYASIWRARYLRTMGVGYLRDAIRFDKKCRRISPAGWHFTSVFDAPGIVRKLNSSSHQEHAGTPIDVLDDMLAQLRRGDYEPGWERWDFDGRFPPYLRAHREEFEDVIL